MTEKNIGKISKKKEPYLYILPAMLLIIFFIIIPMLLGLGTSFYNYKLYDLKVYFCGLQNFKDILTDKVFYISLKNSIEWVLLSLLFQVIFGVSLAFCLNKPFRGKGVYQAIVLAPWAVSGFLIGLIWKWLFNGQYGLINDLLLKAKLIKEPVAFLAQEGTALISSIVANIWYGTPYFAIMTLAALQSIPEELYEVADLDGAGPIKKFLNITLPYIKPTLLVTILLRFIWIFNFGDIVYTMTNGGPANSSEILATYTLNKVYTQLDLGQAAAVGVIFVLILLTYFVLYTQFTKFQEAGDF